ncbi:hypothetical protein TRAPUB_13938 [Trametes pubescens]|uniref:Uncharacterized protein n=1 Tax=Trametes pubescens TaxID=154538 RepID=A0A1M2VPP0_TRAPU|nr:hypothetical protein TRAPUB_13938 [Trametes pubescens]
MDVRKRNGDLGGSGEGPGAADGARALVAHRGGSGGRRIEEEMRPLDAHRQTRAHDDGLPYAERPITISRDSVTARGQIQLRRAYSVWT